MVSLGLPSLDKGGGNQAVSAEKSTFVLNFFQEACVEVITAVPNYGSGCSFWKALYFWPIFLW